jgi:alkanesulfonate monooxygenase SsuD/methylene tetrahydromethanopterin reductase-like flavin-dependent oxidoreductase (luciferase family)
VDVVYAMLWQNWKRERPVEDFVKDEIHLARLAEDLGFDAISSVEHHFDPEYSACPDNFVALAHLAAKTSTIKLVTGACILPWNDPLRVVEKYALLDHLSDHRLVMGFGRGLARIEYEGFGLAMDESRERFDEAAEMVLRGIRTGIVEGAGPFYPQPRVEVHPAPRPELADRVLCVAMSPDSSLAAGDMGADLICFTTKSNEGMLPLLEGYRSRYTAATGRTPRPQQLHDFMYCGPTAEDVTRSSELWLARYYQEVVRHYDFAGKHFASTKGYQHYAQSAAEIREEGMDEATRKYIDVQMNVGTPDQILEKFEKRISILGPTDLGVPTFYGGMTRDQAEASMRLYATEVMPEMRRIAAAYEKQAV